MAPREFHCYTCNKTFDNYDSITKHNKSSIHAALNDLKTTIECQYCATLCRTEADLVKHKDQHKEIIDKEDEKLKRLKAECGSEVQMAVATAFMEMIEYNNPTRKDDVWELYESCGITRQEGKQHYLKEYLVYWTQGFKRGTKPIS